MGQAKTATRQLDSLLWRTQITNRNTIGLYATSSYKYLGMIITSDGDKSQEIKSRMGQAKTATRQLSTMESPNYKA